VIRDRNKAEQQRWRSVRDLSIKTVWKEKDRTKRRATKISKSFAPSAVMKLKIPIVNINLRLDALY
jgi:hypothetical protein